MDHLTHDQFFRNLADLFTARRDKRRCVVYLSQKRLSHDQDVSGTGPFPDRQPNQPLPLVVRAYDSKARGDTAKRVRLSTIVKPDDIDGFYTRYAEVCKAGMTTLKPRDRSKKKLKAKKKKGALGATGA